MGNGSGSGRYPRDDGSLTETEGIVQSLVPYIVNSYVEGGKKSKYFGYILAGFSKYEAVKLAKVHIKTVNHWEKDPEFIQMMDQLPELKKQLSDQIIDIEYTRNFRLLLDKDFKILFKDAMGETLTPAEDDYLKLIRKFYTPQQLVMIKQLVGGGPQTTESFDFTKTIIELRLTKEEVHVER